MFVSHVSTDYLKTTFNFFYYTQIAGLYPRSAFSSLILRLYPEPSLSFTEIHSKLVALRRRKPGSPSYTSSIALLRAPSSFRPILPQISPSRNSVSFNFPQYRMRQFGQAKLPVSFISKSSSRSTS
ncbi:uncharacterized protein LOC110024803 [Phalaenopsis equestris]|uniref:uncharacterized protein LOC110024803 n=1 Tax=Phalaenopsis equestris TaxID=78828 RepID=UPI0009E217D6|nr:uncharacterized protein LOC110024803 [Phalaenopsis equestris]